MKQYSVALTPEAPAANNITIVKLLLMSLEKRISFQTQTIASYWFIGSKIVMDEKLLLIQTQGWKCKPWTVYM